MKQKESTKNLGGEFDILGVFVFCLALLLGATEEREEDVPLLLPQKHGGRWESSNTG